MNASKIVDKEIRLRYVRIDKDTLETRRSSIRWLALTIGIINPGETRQSVLSVIDAILEFQFVRKTKPTAKELFEFINKSPIWGKINEKTLRYHLTRLKKKGLLENKEGRFYLFVPENYDIYSYESWANSLFEREKREIAERISSVIRAIENQSKIR
ncbi:MAG: hypothetical protein QXL16_02975 [Candidatus Micrarchaeaceae archaeon]